LVLDPTTSGGYDSTYAVVSERVDQIETWLQDGID
jgi:hypothetical protein